MKQKAGGESGRENGEANNPWRGIPNTGTPAATVRVWTLLPAAEG